MRTIQLLRTSFIFCALLLGQGAPLQAEVLNDVTGTLNPTQVQELTAIFSKQETLHSIQITVFILDSLPGAASRGNGQLVEVDGVKTDRGIFYMIGLKQGLQELSLGSELQATMQVDLASQLAPLIGQHNLYGALKLFAQKIDEGLQGDQQVFNSETASQFEREKARYSAMGDKVIYIILAGAAIFCIWAAFYKKRYREQFTVNGRYVGIGTKFYHDHFETEHWDPNFPGGRHGGIKPEDDPGCYQRYQELQERNRDAARREQKARKGGGASGSWQ